MDDIFSRVSNGGARMDLNTLFKMNDLTTEVQHHLARVYASLLLAVTCAAIGAYADMLYNLGGILSFLGQLGVLFWMAKEAPQYHELQVKRVGQLALFGVLTGMGLGRLIAVALMVDPSIVVTAFVGTTVIFACFSLGALVSKRRRFLYLGSTLGSMLSLLMLLNFFSHFSAAAFDVSLYLGLLVFMGYVIYDTQLILESAILGSRDFAWHAVMLFVDFVAIFVRVLIILMKNASKKERGRSNNRR